MSEPIDIREPMNQVWRLLGLQPWDVAGLSLTPSEAIVSVFLENEDGKKYVDEFGHAALEIRKFDVIT